MFITLIIFTLSLSLLPSLSSPALFSTSLLHRTLVTSEMTSQWYEEKGGGGSSPYTYTRTYMCVPKSQKHMARVTNYGTSGLETNRMSNVADGTLS